MDMKEFWAQRVTPRSDSYGTHPVTIDAASRLWISPSEVETVAAAVDEEHHGWSLVTLRSGRKILVNVTPEELIKEFRAV